MYRDSCDAFYVKLRGDGTNCHMVEESDTKRTIGYGQDRLDVYYVKQVSKVRSDGKIEIRSQRVKYFYRNPNNEQQKTTFDKSHANIWSTKCTYNKYILGAAKKLNPPPPNFYYV